MGLLARILGGLLYGASAAVQLNDPDPLPWFFIYAVAGVLVMLPMRGRGIWAAHLAVAGVALVWAASLVPDALALPALGLIVDEMKATTPSIEAARETLGLVLVAMGTGGRAWACSGAVLHLVGDVGEEPHQD